MNAEINMIHITNLTCLNDRQKYLFSTYTAENIGHDTIVGNFPFSNC